MRVLTHRQHQPILECEERAGLGPGLSESLMPRLVESFMLYSAPQIIITSRYSRPALRFHTIKPSIPRRELTGVWTMLRTVMTILMKVKRSPRRRRMITVTRMLCLTIVLAGSVSCSAL